MQKFNKANSEPSDKGDGLSGTGVSFVFEAISSNEDRQSKGSTRKWKRVARNLSGRNLTIDKGINQASLAQKRRSLALEGKVEGVKKVKEVELVFSSGNGNTGISAAIGDKNQSRWEP